MGGQWGEEIARLGAGLVCLAAALGIGAGVLGGTKFQAPRHWYFPLALLVGTGISETAINGALYLGGGVRTLRIVGTLLLIGGILGAFGLWARFRKEAPLVPLPEPRWTALFVALPLLLNLMIALAPSTKIDELHYHMLVPKRIVQDNGLRPYRRPYEAAIYPQMAFQNTLAAVHAAGMPETGNVISWGLGAALILFITGAAAGLTRSGNAGWAFGGIAVVGLYTAVWHVTSGAHALGDLATVLGFCLFLFPREETDWIPERQRLWLICVAAAIAASTKISLLPASGALSLLAAASAGRQIGWKAAAGILALVWCVLYVPAVVWSAVETGTPFGIATAHLFHSPFFDPDTIALLAESKKLNQTGLVHLMKEMLPSVSAGTVLGFLVVAANARKSRSAAILAIFVTVQIILIALLLPHEFRFLGGLQFVVLLAAARAFSQTGTRGNRLVQSPWVAVALCAPWLAVQTYYSLPFLSVDLGQRSREAFLEHYVAFWNDYRQLDQIVPADAVLYVRNARIPSYYAPRPVIFTMLDAAPGKPVYRFKVGNPDLAGDPVCDEPVYSNPRAVSYAFRTRPPVFDSLTVERCR